MHQKVLFKYIKFFKLYTGAKVWYPKTIVWKGRTPMPHMFDRKITILLTQYPTTMASALCWLTDFPYTHTSIGLSEDRNTYYSFV